MGGNLYARIHSDFRVVIIEMQRGGQMQELFK